MPDLFELMGWWLLWCVISALCVIFGKWAGVLTISWGWIPLLLLAGILPLVIGWAIAMTSWRM